MIEIRNRKMAITQITSHNSGGSNIGCNGNNHHRDKGDMECQMTKQLRELVTSKDVGSIEGLDMDDLFESIVRSGNARRILLEYDDDGMIPLHYALKNGADFKIVEKLLSYKGAAREQATAVIKGGPFRGFYPLHLCCRYGVLFGDRMTKAAALLIQNGAGLAVRSEESEVPLHVCAKYGSTDVARLLVEDFGANINERSRLGITPLMYAASQGRHSIAELLLEQEGIHINARDTFGDNALHHAFQTSLQRLIPNGVDVPQENEPIAYILARNGIDIHARPDDGLDYTLYCSASLNTILSIASSHGDQLPRYLDALVALPDHAMGMLQLPPNVLGELMNAVREYRQDIAEYLAKQQSQGMCPVSKGNRYILARQREKKKKEKGVSSSEGGPASAGRCPFGFTEKDGPMPEWHKKVDTAQGSTALVPQPPQTEHINLQKSELTSSALSIWPVHPIVWHVILWIVIFVTSYAFFHQLDILLQ